VNVYGNIIHSHIHNNYFGVYTFGADRSQWLDNEVDHNAGYGLDPHDDSDSMLIEGNSVHHNGFGNLHNAAGGPRGLHGIIASRRCDHLIIRHNRSWANAGNGIMLHRHCDDVLIEGNESYSNGDSGIAIFDSDRTVVRANTILSNSNAGIRLSVGSADNQVLGNEIGFSGTNGVYFFAGANPPEPDDADPTVTSRPRRNRVANNSIHDCGAEGLKVTGADENQFVGNSFQANSALLRFQESASNLLDGNLIPDDVTIRTVGSSMFQTSITLGNQPYVSVDMDSFSAVSFVDDQGAIFDPIQVDVPVTVGPEGSSLTLIASRMDARVTVVTRDFQVTRASSVLVTPTVWNLGGDLSKQWVTQSANQAQSIRYVVGDLSPNKRYTVNRDNGSNDAPGAGNGRGKKKRVQSVVADASGRIAFSDSPGSTRPVGYSVVPQNSQGSNSP
jgi:parallel beta-helix repeat protein